jgi:hypothetical protein
MFVMADVKTSPLLVTESSNSQAAKNELHSLLSYRCCLRFRAVVELGVEVLDIKGCLNSGEAVFSPFSFYFWHTNVLHTTLVKGVRQVHRWGSGSVITINRFNKHFDSNLST